MLPLFRFFIALFYYLFFSFFKRNYKYFLKSLDILKQLSYNALYKLKQKELQMSTQIGLDRDGKPLFYNTAFNVRLIKDTLCIEKLTILVKEKKEKLVSAPQNKVLWIWNTFKGYKLMTVSPDEGVAVPIKIKDLLETCNEI